MPPEATVRCTILLHSSMHIMTFTPQHHNGDICQHITYTLTIALNLDPLTMATYTIEQERLWCSGSTLGCRSTGQAIDPASGAWFITKNHLISPACPWPSIALQYRILAYLTISSHSLSLSIFPSIPTTINITHPILNSLHIMTLAHVICQR